MLTPQEVERLTARLAQELGAKQLLIGAIRRFHGGASRETYGLDVIVDGVPRGLILRRDPADSLIDTERALEFAAFRSFAASTLPVPEAICLVEDCDVLGAPFFVMERIDGGAAASPFDPEFYGEHRAAIGQQFFSLLGGIHAVEAQHSPLAAVAGTPAHCWQRELDHWEKVIRDEALEPQPIAMAALRWLRRTPPAAPVRQTIVHGDYRTGNLLHDGAGKVIAILDWEMAHIGDPLEDLAWALDPLWNPRAELDGGGMITRGEAIALWEAASGLEYDAARFGWWEMFATVKGVAIWLSSSRAFAEGRNLDPILAFSGFYTLARANQTLATRLSAGADA